MGTASNRSADQSAKVGIEAIYRAYGNRLLNQLRRKFGNEIAEDATQQVFLRLVEGKRPDPGLPEWPWLITVAENAARDYIRKTIRQTSSLEHSEDFVEDSHSYPLDRIEIEEAVARLPRTERVVISRELAGSAPEETAAALNRSTHAIYCLASRARARLRKTLR